MTDNDTIYGISDSRITGHETDSDVRMRGNSIIYDIIGMNIKRHPQLEKLTVHPKDAYNETDTIQRTCVSSEKAVRKLVKWRNDGRTDTWNWEMPILMKDKDDKLVIFATKSAHWLERTCKGHTAIAIMAPVRLIFLTCPEYYTYDKYDRRQTLRIDEDDVEYYNNVITAGKTPQTPWLDVSQNMMVSGQEPYETVCSAIAAMNAGIAEMPVYLNRESWTDDERTKLAAGDTSILWSRIA